MWKLYIKHHFILKLSTVLFLMVCWYLLAYPDQLKRTVNPTNTNNRSNWYGLKDGMVGNPIKYCNDNNRRTDVPQMYQDRITRMCVGCANDTARTGRGRMSRFFYSKTSNIAFCKAPKSGSTFVGTLVSALEYKGELKNMFHVNREVIHVRNEIMLSSFPANKANSATIVLVSRNPYTRLFSAFIDKYFLLGKWGRDMAKVKGKGHYKMGNGYCGYNVSFQEVLDFIVTKRTVDEHTLPVTSLCNPCTVHYSILCKQETLEFDIEHVMNVINIKESKRTAIMKMINDKTLSDTLFAWISSHLQYYNTRKKDCSDRILFMEKLWQALQLRGYIRLAFTFPAREFKTVTEWDAEGLTALILKLITSAPLSRSQMVKQQKRVLAEAYSRIDPSTLTGIQTLFAQDFHLFGYDSSVPVL